METRNIWKFLDEPLKERLKKNSITNILYFILTFPILFFITPLIIKYVGKELYGVWVLTGTILVFVELFANMQMSSAISILIPKFDAKKQGKDINEFCNTLFFFYFFISVLFLIIYFLFKEDIINIFFKVDKSYFGLVSFILTFSMCLFFMNFVLLGITYVLGGFNIFYINNIMHIIIGYLRAGLMVFVLFSGFGIKGIVIVQMTTILFETIILVFFTKIVFSGLKIGINYFSLDKLKIMFNMAFKLLFSRIAVQFNNNIDKLILGYFLNPVVIAYYQLGAGIAKYITSIPEMLGLASLLPAASELKAKNQNEKIAILYNRVNKYIFFVAILLCSGFIIFGKDFINLWLGEGFYDAYVALSVLSIAYTLGIAGFAAMNLLNGMEKINETMVVSIITAILNIILSILLTKFYGLKGAATGTLISMGVGSILFYILFFKIVRIHLNIIDVFIKPVICVIIAYGCNYLIELRIVLKMNWMVFSGKTILFSIIYILAAYFVVSLFDNYDKDIIKNYLPFLKSKMK